MLTPAIRMIAVLLVFKHGKYLVRDFDEFKIFCAKIRRYGTI